MTHTKEQVVTRSLVATTLLDAMGTGPRVEDESRLSYEVRNTAGAVFVNWAKSAQKRFEEEQPRSDAERKVFLQAMITASTNFATSLIAFAAFAFLEDKGARSELRAKIVEAVGKKLDTIEIEVGKAEEAFAKVSKEEFEALSALVPSSSLSTTETKGNA